MNKLSKIIALAVGLLLPVAVLAQETDWKALSHYEKIPVKKQLTDRLTEYTRIDTQAKKSSKVPSTPGQLKLAKMLAKELKKNGAVNVKTDKYGIVTAEIASNLSKPAPVLAFIAHVDTNPAVSAQNVKPQVHENYKGGTIVINAEKKLALDPYVAPQLMRAKGHDIITASGDTLLGANGKAGLAILVTVAQYFYDHPQLPHGTIKLVFTPDSTTGNGVAHVDTATLAANYAYTLDAGELGQLIDETVSSKTFKAVFEGDRTVALGHAISSPFADNVLMASDFHTLLPRHKRPETTANKNGFIFVDNITTQGNRTEVTGVIRAFSDEEMNSLTQEVTQAFTTVQRMNYKGKNFTLTFADQEKNIKNAIPPAALRIAEQAFSQEEVAAHRTAARDTTDGARLAAKGLPAVGLFTGYYLSGVQEYADVDVMESAFRSVMRITSLWANQKK